MIEILAVVISFLLLGKGLGAIFGGGGGGYGRRPRVRVRGTRQPGYGGCGAALILAGFLLAACALVAGLAWLGGVW